MTFRIVALKKKHRKAAAQLLVDGFRDHWPDAYETRKEALETVDECRALGPVRAAVDADGEVIGWVGVRHNYARVWELHPLVVTGHAREQGVGRALVEAVEKLAADRGGLTLQLGSDDEDDMTSLAGVDLYPDPLRHLSAIEDRKRHPFGFYLKCGFSVVGVVPDANGFGKPDIILAKRVARA
jgi:aminoglycoside 6'-N-acetyltransferase I